MADAIPHHHTLKASPGATPTRRMAFLHGSFGSGRNWAAAAQRLVKSRPDYAATLVDLRGHGDSIHLDDEPTLAAAAHDVDRLVDALGTPFDALLGHSLGGKVALRWAERLAEADANRGHACQVWVIDSTPDPRADRGSAQHMLEIIRDLPDRFEARAQAVAALESRGIASPVAQWMATNLVRDLDGEGLRWRFDAGFMQGLLDDFYDADVWRPVEQPSPRVDLHLVRAIDSDMMSPGAAERVRAAAAACDRVHLHELPGGHWLHIDNPGGLNDLMAQRLPR